jgi:plastocyanin
MRERRWFALLVLVSTVALVSAACSKKSSGSSSSSAKTTIDGVQANDHGSKSISGVSSVEVELDNDDSGYYFSPTVINGTAGQKVTVELSNEGNTAHTFTIDSASIDQELQPGTKTSTTVTLPSSGTLVFYCKFHRNLGMLGEFSVG